jgi:hypothetical protein
VLVSRLLLSQVIEARVTSRRRAAPADTCGCYKAGRLASPICVVVSWGCDRLELERAAASGRLAIAQGVTGRRVDELCGTIGARDSGKRIRVPTENLCNI